MILYGHPMSRANRPLWLLHELGVPFEHVPTHFATGETRKPEFLAINPNGHVPALVDGDVKLFESMAINLYLARKYDGGLWPKSVADEGRAYQWSFWAMTEAEEPLLTWLMNTVIRPPDQRDPAKAEDAKQRLAKPLDVLEGALRGRPYLLGPSFSIADLNVASVLMWARLGRIDLSRWPWVDAWLTRCLDRPAAKKASGRG
ncbi:MAG TPA: glutathione S-transferase family protein [Myxococcota bacterium]|nr:glutathione S-transferase family protein [Myxococcota bacterium]